MGQPLRALSCVDTPTTNGCSRRAGSAKVRVMKPGMRLMSARYTARWLARKPLGWLPSTVSTVLEAVRPAASNTSRVSGWMRQS
ncbi:hypothetical protein [Macromonas bipunctata]|uniref:hypothetical protein n=1 Tax=Macromonas bipunctata TaxID=183670 RepID=UPI003B82D703